MTAKDKNKGAGQEEMKELDFRHKPGETEEQYWDRVATQMLGGFDSYKQMEMVSAKKETKH
jgi:hypothetical protein